MPRGIPKNGKRAPWGSKKAARMAADNGVVAMQATVFDEPAPEETMEQAKARIAERFEVMHLMTDATAAGGNRAFIISGPAGVGKSVGVERVLAQKVETHGIEYEMVRGMIRQTGLYKLLYEHRHPNSVLVLDDADVIFGDDLSLNLLKAACDTTSRRMISWRAETRMEDEAGERLPTSFEFEGSVIFITNYDFDKLIARGNRLAPHFEALISRAHYLDLTLRTKRDYMIRIKQVVESGMLAEHGLDPYQETMTMAWFENNSDRLRELSLRMVLKIAGLVKARPDAWEKIASATCLRNNA